MKTRNTILLGSLLSVTGLSAANPTFADVVNADTGTLTDGAKGQEHKALDHEVIGRIHMLNMHVIHLSQLAVHQSKTEKVREFARKLVQDHLILDQSLMNLAHEHNFFPGRIIANLSDTPQIRQEHRDLMTRLGKLKEASFEQAYLEAMVRVHESEENRINLSFKDLSESDIQKYIEKLMPMMSAHLEGARSLLTEI